MSLVKITKKEKLAFIERRLEDLRKEENLLKKIETRNRRREREIATEKAKRAKLARSGIRIVLLSKEDIRSLQWALKYLRRNAKVLQTAMANAEHERAMKKAKEILTERFMSEVKKAGGIPIKGRVK